MLLEIVDRPKSATADSARIRSFSSMDNGVAIEPHGISETLLTDITAIKTALTPRVR
jgi:hypothetical protein